MRLDYAKRRQCAIWHELRKAKEMTLAEYARELGVHRVTFSAAYRQWKGEQG